MRILLVEDDDSIAKVLEKGFISEHYAVDIAKDGQMGWQLVNAFNYDLIVLDVVLPRLDGIEFCQRLRDRAYQMPVLMVTALDSSTRKIAGLNAGADDYITKPFELAEILARVRVLLRRAQTPILSVLEWGDLQLNPNTRDVTYGETILNLTPKEYRLLELFLRKPAQVFSRSAILDSLWNCGEAPGEETVTAHIKGLRRKLTQVGASPDLIKTVYGVGYRLKSLASSDYSPTLRPPIGPSPEQEPVSPVTTRPAHLAPGGADDPRQRQTQAALQSLWEQVKPQHDERLALIKQAVQALAANRLTVELHQQAYRAAHGLKGALGVFGLTQGSELAGLIEQGLGACPPPLDGLPQQPQLWVWAMALTQELVRGPVPSEPIDPKPAIPLLVISDNSPQLTHDLAQAAKQSGLTVESITDVAQLQTLRQRITGAYHHWLGGDAVADAALLPDLGLFNYSLHQADEASLAAVAALIDQMPLLPMVVCSPDGSLSNRIKAAQLGHPTFLHNPDVPQILSRGALLRSPPPAKVLVVDDDPQMLAALRAMLEPWGTQLTTLNGPPNFWQTLQTAAPDLVVLDIEMPDFSGLDLCRVVRQTPMWQHLPVVFLTAYADAAHKHAAMLAGANDLIDKSLGDTDLIKRLFCQIKRTRLQPPVAALSGERLDPAIS
ncbi:MAG: response regulator [Nodosilinea sp.]